MESQRSPEEMGIKPTEAGKKFIEDLRDSATNFAFGGMVLTLISAGNAAMAGENIYKTAMGIPEESKIPVAATVGVAVLAGVMANTFINRAISKESAAEILEGQEK